MGRDGPCGPSRDDGACRGGKAHARVLRARRRSEEGHTPFLQRDVPLQRRRLYGPGGIPRPAAARAAVLRGAAPRLLVPHGRRRSARPPAAVRAQARGEGVSGSGERRAPVPRVRLLPGQSVRCRPAPRRHIADKQRDLLPGSVRVQCARGRTGRRVRCGAPRACCEAVGSEGGLLVGRLGRLGRGAARTLSALRTLRRLSVRAGGVAMRDVSRRGLHEEPILPWG